MTFGRPLKWSEWVVWVLANEPSRVFDAGERDRWCAEYWAAHPLLDGQQRRRAGLQGVLASHMLTPAAHQAADKKRIEESQ